MFTVRQEYIEKSCMKFNTNKAYYILLKLEFNNFVVSVVDTFIFLIIVLYAPQMNGVCAHCQCIRCRKRI